MKNLGLTLMLLCFITANAQDIKLNDGTVLLNEKAVFSYEKKGMNNQFHFYKLNTKEELVSLIHQHVGTDTGAKDDFKKMVFPMQNTIIESRVLQKRNWKFLIQLLLDEKVLDTSGTIDLRNLERFAGKYDEKITPRK